MDSLEIIKCEATEEHAKLVMSWRNDATTLSFSFDQKPKIWNSFWEEYIIEYLAKCSLPPIFVSSKGTPKAFLRFRTIEVPQFSHERISDISLMVNPVYRGRGFGKASLLIAANYAKEKGFQRLIAEIFEANVPSIKTFESAGFKFFTKIDKNLKSSSEIVQVGRYSLDLHGLES